MQKQRTMNQVYLLIMLILAFICDVFIFFTIFTSWSYLFLMITMLLVFLDISLFISLITIAGIILESFIWFDFYWLMLIPHLLFYSLLRINRHRIYHSHAIWIGIILFSLIIQVFCIEYGLLSIKHGWQYTISKIFGNLVIGVLITRYMYFKVNKTIACDNARGKSGLFMNTVPTKTL